MRRWKEEKMEPVLKSRVDHGVYRWQSARGDAVPGQRSSLTIIKI